MNTLLPALVRFGDALGRTTSRWVPSAFSIAMLLSVATFLLATLWAGAGVDTTVKAWGDGFFSLLSFSMQMALVLFSGYLLALSRPVKRLLERLAAVAPSPRGAVLLMALLSMGLAYVNWGLSIVGSAMLLRAIVRRQPKVDFRLLVAAGYFGLGATWHAGLSASAPLLVATPKHFLEGEIGVIPVGRTLFSPFNLGLLALTVALLAGLAYVLHPSPDRAVTVDPSVFAEPPEPAPEPPPAGGGFARWLDHSGVLNAVFAVAGAVWLFQHLRVGGWRALNIDVVNFVFLALAIALHRTPSALLRASEEAASSLHGIVLQFPLYAGIYGIFKTTGLAERMGETLVAWSTRETFPTLVYWYSGIVNYFVPSGGSKWAIEAPYLLHAARELAVAPEKVVLAYAWGDMATDLIQPFWALPLLAVAKVEFKEVFGYLLLAFLCYAPMVTIAFLLAGGT